MGLGFRWNEANVPKDKEIFMELVNIANVEENICEISEYCYC